MKDVEHRMAKRGFLEGELKDRSMAVAYRWNYLLLTILLDSESKYI